MGWSLGADLRGLYREDSEFAKPMVEDSHCENCGDAYPAREVIEGWCFLCAYGDKTRMFKRFKARGF